MARRKLLGRVVVLALGVVAMPQASADEVLYGDGSGANPGYALEPGVELALPAGV